MIRMIQSSSAGHTKAYFSDALAQSDYYINDQELQGKIEGRLADRLGIKGKATKETFFALAENIDPKTGKPLTLRTKEDRTVGYDINFHCPKSVSIIHALSNDNHILEAFEQSVLETMMDIEADVQTRIRKGGRQEDRPTGELAWASFTHQTARPVADQAPDPHLHSHCFAFNATWDNEEKQYKAAKFRDIKRDMPYYQARFHKRLSDKLIGLHYQIRQTAQSFELVGVPGPVIDLFSKRTDEIGRLAKEKGITDAKGLDALGARTRSKKQKGLSMAELKETWRKQIRALPDTAESDHSAALRFAPVTSREKVSARECLAYAVNHCFERVSVVQDRRLLANAYRYAMGKEDVTLDAITQRYREEENLIRVKEKSKTMCTTRTVLQEEKRMVEMARQGIGRIKPLYQKAPVVKLTGKQGLAVNHILTTQNRVSIVRGAAGTGKTTLMQEAVSLIEQKGKKVMVVAPSAEASRGVLAEEGFSNAQTVARLLIDRTMQEALQDGVLWVDEAGLLSTGDMTALLQLTEKRNAQLILGGDTRQHASVVRGDALRILNTVGGIRAAEVTKIFRQKSKDYRTAVEFLSKGDVQSGFEALDKLGAIQTIDPSNPNHQLVKDYVGTLKKGKRALVISPTHKQGEAVTGDIRKELRKEGRLGKKEITAKRLVNLNLTNAQKKDSRNFTEGQVVQFNQNYPGIRRGSSWIVKENNSDGVVLTNENYNTVNLPKDKDSHFDVFKKSEIHLSKGDRIRVTRNGYDNKEKRLNNGQILEVTAVSKKGEIIALNPISKSRYRLKSDFGHIAHAYCVTSHASQGKTVDEVFIAQPSSTFSATDAKQFYVSVSRAKEAVHIYTDDREALLEHAAESGDRQSALELVSGKQSHQSYVNHRLQGEPNFSRFTKNKAKDSNAPERVKEPSYEPGI